MVKAVRNHRVDGELSAPPRSRDWRKAMSDNVAYSLLVYTGLQIFMTITAMKKIAEGSSLPFLSLIILVAAIIPACRWFERRWDSLTDVQAADPSLRGYFRRDQALLWLMAIGLPFLLTGIIIGIEQLI